MAYIKINVDEDKKTGKFILGEFKSLAFNSKTQFTVERTEYGLQGAKITGELNGQKFIITPIDKKRSDAYNVKVGNYEVDIQICYNEGWMREKFTRVINGVQDRIRNEYIHDENTGQYLPRPKLPNFFQRLFGFRGK